jgi:hypothetical protein
MQSTTDTTSEPDMLTLLISDNPSPDQPDQPDQTTFTGQPDQPDQPDQTTFTDQPFGSLRNPVNHLNPSQSKACLRFTAEPCQPSQPFAV